MVEAWETGQMVIVALLWWLAGLSILAGMACAGVGMGAVWLWKRIRAQAATGPRSGLGAPVPPDPRPSVGPDAEPAQRRSEPPMRKEAA